MSKASDRMNEGKSLVDGTELACPAEHPTYGACTLRGGHHGAHGSEREVVKTEWTHWGTNEPGRIGESGLTKEQVAHASR